MSGATRKPVRRFSESNPTGMASLQDVEIFAAGTRKGKTYTPKDLDDIAANFARFCAGQQPLYRVPAVAGHEEEQEFLDRTDLPAMAWATRLKRARKVCPACRMGAKQSCPECQGAGKLEILLADFADVPPSVAQLLRQHAYRTVSAEVYDSPPEGVPGSGKMLRRVAFLGGSLPQIKSLADIPPPQFSEFAPAYTAVVTRLATIRAGKTPGTFHVFSEVKPMTRDEMLAKLAEMGIDTSLLTEVVPDEALAAMLQAMEGAAPAPEPEMPEETQLADPPANSTPAPTMPAPAGPATAVPAPTPRPVQPQRQPNQVVWKYSELQAQVNRLTSAVDKIEKGLTAKVTALDKFAEDRLAAEKRATIKARLDTLVQQGKVLPAERDAGLDDAAYLLDATTVHKFSENGKQVQATAFDRFFKTLEARPALARFGEKVKTGGKTSPDEELSKVTRFSEDPDFNHTLKVLGKTPESYVQDFTKAREKMPALTAAQYGVPAQYHN